jgi:hypothetical protein
VPKKIFFLNRKKFSSGGFFFTENKKNNKLMGIAFVGEIYRLGFTPFHHYQPCLYFTKGPSRASIRG